MAIASETNVKIKCPSVMATKVIEQKYGDWIIYSNDPLRLTGADILIDVENEDGLLDSDETKDLHDENLSVIKTFHLTEHRDIKSPVFVCYYGDHAQLSRYLPKDTVECNIIHHLRIYSVADKYEASCH